MREEEEDDERLSEGRRVRIRDRRRGITEGDIGRRKEREKKMKKKRKQKAK